MALHNKIFIGLLFGIALGIAANLAWGGSPRLEWFIVNISEPFGRIFLRLIFMIVIPLIFSALTLGVANLGDIRRLGRVGLKTLAYTLVVTSISVIIGLALVNTIRPGEGLSPEIRSQLLESIRAKSDVSAVKSGGAGFDIQMLVRIVPDNPLGAMVNAFNGEMLGVMFFSLMFGVALALVDRERVQALVTVLEGIYEVVMKIIDLAMKLAPYGVGALIFTLTARFGHAVLLQLAAFVAVVLAGLAIHQFVVYSLLIRFLVGMNPLKFFRSIKAVMITAFATSSSNATLPTALKVSQENLGIPREISGFVLTLGSTANQNGTALYEGVTVLFLAQFFGIHLGWESQLLVVLMSVLSGVGTAGVPGGSIPVIVLLLESVGIPGGSIGIILGVDRLLDMCRTVLNVTGDIAAAAFVAKSEGYKLEHGQ
jgi:dicarboxylate/amino acid:cation (Na+ or H+) symporter, DAACS family